MDKVKAPFTKGELGKAVAQVFFSKAGSDFTSFTVWGEYAIASRSASAGEERMASAFRFRLMSCSTPRISPLWLVIGMLSTDRVR